MKRGISESLRAALAISFLSAIILFVLHALLAVAMAFQFVFWKFKVPGWEATYVIPTVTVFIINSWFLARAYKARHFLGLFSEWPGLALAASEHEETRLNASAAGQAFHQGEFGRVPFFLDRLKPVDKELALARGRALALEADFDAAVLAHEEAGHGKVARRWIATRRAYGFLWKSRYFGTIDVDWARKPARLAWGALLSVALSLPLFWLNWSQFQSVRQDKVDTSFSAKDFKTYVSGKFTFYYHDAEFLRQVDEIASEGLEQNLKFLGLPLDTSFEDGEIKLYLCTDQKEYMSRSPFTKEWEAASAFPDKNEIYLYQFEERRKIFFEEVVTHELAHLCYHLIVPGSRATQDSWLNEGLADYLGYLFALKRAGYPREDWLMERYFKRLKSEALPFQNFLEEDPRIMQDRQRISTFYVQGFSIVYVLIEYYGRESFLQFLRHFGAGKSLAEALTLAYPTIRNAGELQAVWTLFMK